MSKLFIICGLPGSGKTTIAQELSKKLKITCLHKDSIKENLYDILGHGTLADSKALGKHSSELLLKLAEEQVASGVDLIVEAPFNFNADYEIFRQWEKDYSVTIFSIICSIPFEERTRRFNSRPRHRAHHDKERPPITNEDGTFYQSLPGKKINITTDQPTAALLEFIITQVN